MISDDSAASKPVAIELHHVSKQFASEQHIVNAIQDISLTLHKGSVVGLVGPDGAGKTTLLRLVAGLLLPSAGSIQVLGYDTEQQVDQVHRVIGYMPQRFGLYEDLSVAENLNLYADLHGVSPKLRLERFNSLVQMTGLSSFTQRLAGNLSGGMKQKLGLACTLLSQPEVLLLDEPSVGVDPVSRRELWAIIEDQVKTNAMTVLLSTAYLDEAERCDEVIFLDAGKKLNHNSPDSFKHKMQGYCYLISHKDYSNRALQLSLTGQLGIIDAVIQGDKVRVVSQTKQLPDLPLLTKNDNKLQIEATQPRLEDAFMAELIAYHPSIHTATSMPSITAMTDEEVILVDQVDRWFGDFQAVKKLSFSVKRGEIFGLLGANGAGKTTTFRMLCGLLPSSNGQLRVVGLDLAKAAAKARARIGYMSQKFSLYSSLSVRQNLSFFSSAYGLRNKQRQQRIQWAIQEFALEEVQDIDSSLLPLGYKQRLAMACALMHEPEILFLDEPTSGVDPLARREFWNRTNQLAASGVTVLVTTHFMEEAEYCDRLVIMVDGDILTAGTPAKIKAQISSPEMPNPTMEDAFIQLVEAS